MKIEDIEIGKYYFVEHGFRVYRLRSVAKGEHQIVFESGYFKSNGSYWTVEPEYVIAIAPPVEEKPSIFRRIFTK